MTETSGVMLTTTAPILTPEQHWVCPNCTATDVTHEARPHTRFHACRGLRGLTAPFVSDGVRCKVEAREREDFIGPHQVAQHDGEGRAIMSVVTTRDEGNDAAMLAPCPTAKLTRTEFDRLMTRFRLRGGAHGVRRGAPATR